MQTINTMLPNGINKSRNRNLSLSLRHFHSNISSLDVYYIQYNKKNITIVRPMQGRNTCICMCSYLNKNLNKKILNIPYAILFANSLHDLEPIWGRVYQKEKKKDYTAIKKEFEALTKVSADLQKNMQNTANAMGKTSYVLFDMMNEIKKIGRKLSDKNANS